MHMRSILILLSTAALAACNMSADAQGNDQPGDGRVTQQSFDVGAFEGVSLAGSHDVVVSVGGAASVRAEGDAAIIERLDIRVEGGTLKIGTKKGVRWSDAFMRNRAPVTIHVTTPRLNAAAIAGSGDMRIDTVAGDAFTASIAGSGDMAIGALRVQAASFDIAGSGDIKAAGSAGTASISIAGSGDVDLTGVATRTAQVSVLGSGDVRATASESADLTVMGSGNVTVTGGGKCSITKRGSGNISCG
jgi:hypothetical protein